MWEHKDKIFVQVKVDDESILGKIAEAQSKMEELQGILRELKNAILFEEKSN
ncbi:MAG: hypothetical protein IIV45_11945 [Lachnospiraceae bacterium]|nr:hypothetical protein [Lachnospiraceae bacterium]